jgi:hypothetical protein
MKDFSKSHSVYTIFKNLVDIRMNLDTSEDFIDSVENQNVDINLDKDAKNN